MIGKALDELGEGIVDVEREAASVVERIAIAR